MVIAKLIAQAEPALNATGSTIRNCASTTNQLDRNSSNRYQEAKEKMMASFGEKSVCYPIMIVNANGIQHRALVNTGAGSSYASAALINCIDTSTVRRETRQMQILLHTTSRKIEIHDLTITNQEGSFKLNIQDITSILQSS